MQCSHDRPLYAEPIKDVSPIWYPFKTQEKLLTLTNTRDLKIQFFFFKNYILYLIFCCEFGIPFQFTIEWTPIFFFFFHSTLLRFYIYYFLDIRPLLFIRVDISIYCQQFLSNKKPDIFFSFHSTGEHWISQKNIAKYFVVFASFFHCCLSAQFLKIHLFTQ